MDLRQWNDIWVVVEVWGQVIKAYFYNVCGYIK